MKMSTGLRNGLLSTGSFASVMNNHVIVIYSGTVPADADAAIGAAVALCEITVGDDGVTPLGYDAAANGVLQKASAETWSGTVDSTGTASFFRMRTQADGDGASTSATRVQGTVGLAGADMNLSSVALTAAAVQVIDTWALAIPVGS